MKVMKICTECRMELEANETNFAKERKGKYGLRSKCRPCDQKIRDSKKEEKKEYDKKYRDKNRDRIRSKVNAYVKEHREEKRIYDKKRRNGKNRDTILLKKREYHERTKEKFKEKYKKYRLKKVIEKRKYDSQYYQKNKEKKRDQNNSWRKNNKDLDIVHKQRYKARKAKLEHSFTVEEWVSCKDYFNNRCAYCGSKESLVQEHFIPVSKNGEYSRYNILPSCKSCNSSKHDKDFLDWYESMEFYSLEKVNKIREYFKDVEN